MAREGRYALIESGHSEHESTNRTVRGALDPRVIEEMGIHVSKAYYCGMIFIINSLSDL